jgi:hypothetical protein
VTVTGWVVAAGLGAFHGMNPAMGWLFAVALGFQEQRSSAVLRAILPIAAGHALSVAAVVAVVSSASTIVSPGALRIIGAGALLAFATLLVVRHARHPRRSGMRVGARQLVLWSFVMASAHGSGLMLLPVLMHRQTGSEATWHMHHAAHDGFLVLAVHTTAMISALAAAALVCYHVFGVGFLRRAWVNLDALWIGALVLAAAVTLMPAW